MSANGATKRDLFRVIAEKDAEIARLFEEVRLLKKALEAITKANIELLAEAGYIA